MLTRLVLLYVFFATLSVCAETIAPPEGTVLAPAAELDGLKLKLLDGTISISAPNADYRWVKTVGSTNPCYMCLNLKTEAEAFSLFLRPDVLPDKFNAEFLKNFIESIKTDLQQRGGALKNEVIEASNIPLNGKSFRVTYTIQMPRAKERDRTVYYTVLNNCLIYFQGAGPESALFKNFVASVTTKK